MVRPVRDRRNTIVVGILLFGLLAVVFLGWGLYEVWKQHSGTAASVTIQSCFVEGPPGKHYQRCTGTWRAAGGTEKTVTIDDTQGWRQLGETVNAHVHGDKATVDSRTVEIACIAIGCGCLGLLVITVIASRSRPNFWI